MRISRAAVALGLVLAGAVSCVEQSPLYPTALEVVVHSVLDVSRADQYVIVQEAFGTPAYQRPMKGAVVTLTLPDSTVVSAIETTDSTIASASVGQPKITTVYRLPLGTLGISLIPGATYHLKVVATTGRVVTGSTTIPNGTSDTTSGPTTIFTAASDTLSLTWSRVAGARTHQLLIKGARLQYDTFADTSLTVPGLARDPDSGIRAFIPGQVHRVVVLAVDGNYYDYYRRTSDIFSGVGLITHLNGGLGLFGSVVPIVSRAVDVK